MHIFIDEEWMFDLTRFVGSIICDRRVCVLSVVYRCMYEWQRKVTYVTGYVSFHLLKFRCCIVFFLVRMSTSTDADGEVFVTRMNMSKEARRQMREAVLEKGRRLWNHGVK